METKQCPDCAEQVLTEAAVCKHCGRRWPAPPAPPLPASHRASEPVRVVFFLLMIAAAAIVVWIATNVVNSLGG